MRTVRRTLASAVAASMLAALQVVIPTQHVLADPAHDFHFIVDSNADDGDAAPGDGACDIASAPPPTTLSTTTTAPTTTTTPASSACTLRAAFDEANAHPGFSTHIVIDEAVSFFAPSTVLDVSSDVEVFLEANGRAGDDFETTFDGMGSTSLFEVDLGGSLTIVDAYIKEGWANAGGCIRTFGRLVLQEVDLIGCTSDSDGGALYVAADADVSTEDVRFVNNDADAGGAIANYGITTLANTRLDQNSATAFGGAIANYGNSLHLHDGFLIGNQAPEGGAIYTAQAATLTLDGVVADRNQADQGAMLSNWSTDTDLIGVSMGDNLAAGAGGAVLVNEGSVSISGGSTFSGNGAQSGGAVLNRAGLTIRDSDFNGNTSTADGGAILNDNTGTATLGTVGFANNESGPTGSGSGGAIHNEGVVTASGLDLDGNASTAGGGGIAATTGSSLDIRAIDVFDGVTPISSTITNNSTTTQGGGIFAFGATTTIAATTIQSNVAGDNGGGLQVTGGTTTISNSSIDANDASNGGGGIFSTGGTVGLTSTFVANNTAVTAGGGIRIITGTVTGSRVLIASNEAQNGGGIFESSGTIQLSNAAIIGNTSFTDGGGATLNTDGSSFTNTTFAANTASGYGGALNLTASPSLSFATVAGNSAGNEGGGINFSDDPDADPGVELFATILADNTAPTGPDCDADGIIAPTSSYVILGDETDCTLSPNTGNATTDPMLAPLSGSTWNQAYDLLPGSPAIDAVPVNICVAGDQRGTARPAGAGCDIGAIEHVVTTTPGTFELSTSAPTVAAGAVSIPLEDVPSSAFLDGAPESGDGSVVGTSIGDTSVPLGAPLASTPLASTPLASTPLASTGLFGLPLASTNPGEAAAVDALRDIRLAEIPLLIDGGWGTCLPGSPFENRTLVSIPFVEAISDPVIQACLVDNDVALQQLDVVASPLASTPIIAFALGTTSIAEIPLASTNANSTPQEILSEWCSVLSTYPGLTCPDFGVNPNNPSTAESTTIMMLTLAGVPLASTPLASTPLASTPLASTPLASTPLASTYLKGNPLASTPLASTPLASTPLASTPLASTPLASTPLASTPLASTPLASTPLASTPLASTPLASTPLASTPLASTPLASTPLASTKVSDISAVNRPFVVDCSDGYCTTPGLTLGQVEADQRLEPGANLGHLDGAFGTLTVAEVLEPYRLTGALDHIVLGDFLQDFIDAGALDDVNVVEFIQPFIDSGDMAQVTLGELILAYLEAPGMDGVTVAEMLAPIIEDNPDAFSNPLLTIGDLLALLLPPVDFNWSEVDLNLIAAQLADHAEGGGTVDLVADINVGDGSASVQIDLPAGFGLVDVDDISISPGATIITVLDDGSGHLVIELGDLTPGADHALTIPLTGRFDIGVTTIDGELDWPTSAAPLGDSTPIEVVEANEPNDTIAQAVPIEEGVLYLTHISTDEDVDVFKLSGVEDGQRARITLGNLGADLDLALYRDVPGAPTSAGAVDASRPDAIGTSLAPQHRVEDVPLLPRPLVAYAGTPGNETEQIRTLPLQGGDYFIQVYGYSGAITPSAATLQVEVVDQLELPPCLPRTFPNTGTPGPTPDVPAGANTLFLINQERFSAAHGDQALADVLEAAEAVGEQTDLGVLGAVVAVESDTGVADAYDDWATDRCDVDLANGVVDAIDDLVDDLREDTPSIRNIVIIGGDEQLPFYRQIDVTVEANERIYAFELGPENNELFEAFATGHYLTDDVLASDDAVVAGDDRRLHTPILAIGRLVETPVQIQQTLDNFIEFDGILDPDTASGEALSMGYDFLDDGAKAIGAKLADAGYQVDELTGPDWTRQDVVERFVDAAPAVSAISAHMDHHRALPAAGSDPNTGSTLPDVELFTTEDVDSPTGPALLQRVVFSVGCHSGLSPDLQIASEGDWAEEFAEEGVGAYAGNSGHGYGDTEIVAYSERLMELYADGLDGGLTVGAAMTIAKQRYTSELLMVTPYDEKVSQQTIVYGLPFFAMPGDGLPPGGTDIAAPSPDGTSGRHVLPVTIDLERNPTVDAPTDDGDAIPDLIERTTNRGRYFEVKGGQVEGGDIEGGTLVANLNPVQPKLTRDISQVDDDGQVELVAHGALITELTHVDVPDFDPHIARPVVDLAANEEEPDVDVSAFPACQQNITSLTLPDGDRQQLVYAPGRWLAEAGSESQVQRLFTHTELEVFYADPSVTDFEPPALTKTSATVDGTHVSIDVTTTPDAVRASVLVTHSQANGVWTPVELFESSPGQWVGGTSVPAGVDVRAFPQALDAPGNIGVSTAKGANFPALVIPDDEDPSLDIELAGAQTNGIYTGDVEVTATLDGTAAGPAAGVEIRVDSDDPAAFVPYTGPVTVSGDGNHSIEVRTLDPERSASDSFVIDELQPEIVIGTPADGAIYEKGEHVEVRFTCADTVSGASCDGDTHDDGDLLDTSQTGEFELTVTSTDGVGRTSEATSTYRVVDITHPNEPVKKGDDYVVTVDGAGSTPVVVDWGDGTSTTGVPDIFSDDVTAVHEYDEPGLFRVRVDVGGRVFEHAFAIVFDPAGDWVTGKGRIDSPLGALESDPFATGEAKFAISSQYRKLTSLVPKGKTQFKLKVGDLKFKSKIHSWMVAVNGRAQLEGIGEVNGVDGYGFMVVTEDGHWASPPPPGGDDWDDEDYDDWEDAQKESKKGGGVGIDGFRIVIWRIIDDHVIYDSELGAEWDDPLSDGALLTKGQIKIQPPKK